MLAPISLWHFFAFLEGWQLGWGTGEGKGGLPSVLVHLVDLTGLVLICFDSSSGSEISRHSGMDVASGFLPGGWLPPLEWGGSTFLFGVFQEGGLNDVVPTEGHQGVHALLKFSCQLTDNTCWDP